MSRTNIWIHVVFATKNRYPDLVDEIRRDVIEHIKQNAASKTIYPEAVNGYTNHMHMLLRLHPTQTLARTVQLIKGESAHWINFHQLTGERFEWQDTYFDTSVHERQLSAIKKYIANQSAHHQGDFLF